MRGNVEGLNTLKLVHGFLLKNPRGRGLLDDFSEFSYF